MQGVFQHNQLSVNQNDNTHELLLHPQNIVRLWECSTMDKLSWLSSVREMLDQGRQPHQGSDALLSCLNRILVEENDRYLIYSAKEAFVAVVTKCNVQNSTRFICDLLPTVRSNPWKLSAVMEIFCQLLSKHNPRCCQFLSKTRESVMCMVDWILDKTSQQRQSDQCLFQIFSIFTKLAKLTVTYPDDEYIIKVIRDVLSSHETMIVNILFMTEGKYYVKKKLMKFLGLLFDQNNGFTKNSILRSSLYQFVKNLLLKFDSVAIETVVWRNGESHFMGREDVADHCDGRFDKGHVRDWTFLGFRMAVTLSNDGTGNNDVWQNVLSRMDACIRQKLAGDTGDSSSWPWLQWPSVMFPWLPVVYGDQDDAWIDVMLLMMDLAGQWKQSDPCSIQPHVYFLQFVHLTGYDHLILVDLLTSPETSFLVFFTRYLKYLIHTLPLFITCIEQFNACTDQSKRVFDVDLASVNVTDDETGTLGVNTDTSDCLVVDEKKGDNGNDDYMVNSEVVRAMYSGNSVDIEDSEAASDLYAIMPENGEGVYDTEKNTLEKESVSIESTSGLAMIIELYSDSEDDDEVGGGCSIDNDDDTDSGPNDDNDKILENLECPEDKNNVSETHPVCKRGNVDTDCKQEYSSGDLYSKSCTKLEDYEIVTKKKSDNNNKSSNVSKMEFDSVQDNSQLDSKHAIGIDNELVDKTPMTDIQNASIHQVTEDIEDEENKEATVKLEEMKCRTNTDSCKTDTDSCKTDTVACETGQLEESVFDKVLGMFVRVRLNLERLRDGQMLLYNPAPLLRLLNAAETMMEETI